MKILSPKAYDSFGNFNSITYDLNLTPAVESKEFDWIKRIGKPKTITSQKAQTLLSTKEVIAIFSDKGEIV